MKVTATLLCAAALAACGPVGPGGASGALSLSKAMSKPQLRRGMNLGDALEAPSEGAWGVVLGAVTSLPNAVAAVYLAGRGRGSAVLSEALNSNSLNVLLGLLVPGVFIGLAHYGGAGLLVASWYAGLTAVSLVLAYLGRGLGRISGSVVVCGYLVLVGVLVAR